MNRHIIRRIACLLVLVCLLCAMPLSASADGNVIIVLDPGHGGGDPGSVATYNGVEYLESDLVWKIANYCKEFLETHYTNVTVYFTRAEDENPSLEERVDYGSSVNADFLLSIHLNVYAEGTARGATALVPVGTYHPEQAEVSQDVGSAILGKLEALGLKNRGLYSQSLKVTKYPNGGAADTYYLLRHGVEYNLPTIIMEECFIDDAQDFQKVLSTDQRLMALAQANAIGLAEYFELTENPDAPVTDATIPPDETTPPETVPPETTAPTEPSIPETEPVPTEKPQPQGSGLGSVLKVIAIMLVGWFLVKCYQFHQFRKRQEERRRRARARAAARRRAQRAQQVQPDGSYPRPQRQMPRSEYERQSRSGKTGTNRRSRSRSDHRNNYIQ